MAWSLSGCGDYTLFPDDKVYPEVALKVDTTSTRACQAKTVTVDGSESRDPGAQTGDVLKFQWSLEKPPGSQAAFANAEAARTTFSPDRPGVYDVTLQVITARETSATQTAVVTAQRGPVAVLPLPGGAVVGTLVELDGSGSMNPLEDCEIDGLVFTWGLTTSPQGSDAVLEPGTGGTASFEPNVTGDYVVRMTVTVTVTEENGDEENLTDTVTIVVTAEEDEPEEDL